MVGHEDLQMPFGILREGLLAGLRLRQLRRDQLLCSAHSVDATLHGADSLTGDREYLVHQRHAAFRARFVHDPVEHDALLANHLAGQVAGQQDLEDGVSGAAIVVARALHAAAIHFVVVRPLVAAAIIHCAMEGRAARVSVAK